jgi:YhcN/YlaJ family sporulation lipoprotein
MKMGRRSFSVLAIALVLGLVMIIGYTASRRNVPLRNQPPIQNQRLNYPGRVAATNPPGATPQPRVIAQPGVIPQPGLIPQPTGILQPNGTPQPTGTPQNVTLVDRQKSDKVAKQLIKMNELRRVGVIVTGNTALVGYSPSKTIKDVNATKTRIADKVKKIDPSITNVVVSESADIMTRINNLTSDVANNRPGNEVGNEVNQLIQSVVPKVR